jgi:hypothetical protein
MAYAHAGYTSRLPCLIDDVFVHLESQHFDRRVCVFRENALMAVASCCWA